jgi:hypothetical protein
LIPIKRIKVGMTPGMGSNLMALGNRILHPLNVVGRINATPVVSIKKEGASGIGVLECVANII